MVDRKTPPPFIQHTSLELLRPEIQTLSNGARIFFVQGGEQDVLKVEFVFRSGKWYEPAPGISHFTSTLLPKGTVHNTSFQITDLFDFYGIHLEISPGFDYSSLSFYGLTRHFPAIQDLMAEIISEATFPENELQQASEIYLQGLKINLEKTSYLASREFRKALFGQNHPYGYEVDESQVRTLQPAQLVNFRDKYFKDFTVYVSGKVSEDVKSGIVRTVERLPYHKAPQSIHSTVTPGTGTQRQVKPGSVQATLRIGKPTLRRNHPDYAGLLLLNQILGGYFGSRLMKNIREEKGLSYGIYSAVHALAHDSYLVIGADVNRDNKDVAIDEITKEIGRLREVPVSSDELNMARNHFVGSLQSELNTPFAHADKIKLIDLFQLPENYYSQLMDAIFTITPDQLAALANRQLAEKDLLTVSVG